MRKGSSSALRTNTATSRFLSLPPQFSLRGPRLGPSFYNMSITELVFGPAPKSFQTNPTDPTLVKPSYGRILKQEGAIK